MKVVTVLVALFATVAARGGHASRRQMQTLTSYPAAGVSTTSLGSTLASPSNYPITASLSSLGSYTASDLSSLPSYTAATGTTSSGVDYGIASVGDYTVFGATSSNLETTPVTLSAYEYPELLSTSTFVVDTAVPVETVEYSSSKYTGADNSRWEALRDSYVVEKTAPGNVHAVITKHLLDVGTWMGWFVQGTYIDSAQGFLGVNPPSGYNFDGSPVAPVIDENGVPMDPRMLMG